MISILLLYFYFVLIICLHTVKLFHVLQSKPNNSISKVIIFCTKLNALKYCDLILITLFDINHLFLHCEMVSIIDCLTVISALKL